MWRIRGKTYATFLAMAVVAFILVLYKITSTDMPLPPEFPEKSNRKGHKQHKFGALDISELSNTLTQSPEHLARQKEYSARIMDGIKSKITQGEKFGRTAMETNDKFLSDIKFQMDGPAERNVKAGQFFSGHRIVHLDLKGAPPKLSYFVELFPLLHSLGATGILLEYEDMFPYNGSLLKDMPAYNAYSKYDILHILNLAKENELEIIPLIQTFGHLEFVLKLEKYIDLREVPKYPQVICPTHPDSFTLISTMIDQVIAMHPGIRFLHIGCDEVYYLGDCPRCTSTRTSNKWTKSQLFLHHVTRIAKYIKKKYPDLTVLTWDDEFRELEETELLDSGIAKLIEPVVWKYTTDLSTSLPAAMWDKYIAVFRSIWIASAFKGATGPDKIITDIEHHIENHRCWMEIVSTYSSKLKFTGIMITGWQRYDHFSVLCELLPVGLPSLAANLLYIQSDSTDMTLILHKAKDLLKCDRQLPLSPSMGPTKCSFPGSGVLEAAERLFSLQQNLEHILAESTAKGWLTQYNINHNFSSPSHVEHATADLVHIKIDLAYIESDMVKAMDDVYDKYTALEWVETYIQPLDVRLEALVDAKEKLLMKSHWPKRPFEIHQKTIDTDKMEPS